MRKPKEVNSYIDTAIEGINAFFIEENKKLKGAKWEIEDDFQYIAIKLE
jgi:hypothetical protein